MKDDTRRTLIICGSILTVFLVLIGGIFVYSGVSPPFSVINSGSMQHSDDTSSIGIIDTGDMVIVKDPSSHGITTYVEGSKTGYTQFGEYGDVIIYKTSSNNIIHRAMLELTLKENSASVQEWYIPSLDGYDDWDIGYTTSGSFISLKESLWDENDKILSVYETNTYFIMKDVGYAQIDVTTNLWNVGEGRSAGYTGYLTKGDNAHTNSGFDQDILSMTRHELVQDDDIKSVAIVEIPWLGSIKLLVTGKNVDSIPSNSILSLVITCITIIAVCILINYLIPDKTREKKG